MYRRDIRGRVRASNPWRGLRFALFSAAVVWEFLIPLSFSVPARIQMRHEGSPHVALSSTVGKAAKLEVKDDIDGPRFVPFYERRLGRRNDSPMRFDEEAATQPRTPARSVTKHCRVPHLRLGLLMRAMARPNPPLLSSMTRG